MSPSRTDEEGFLQAIRSAPDDPVPRLIFADWLEEQGDPRADFIRQHCELDEQGVADAAVVRERERLEQQQRRTVITRLGHLGVRDVRFRAGFVDKVLIQGTEFLKRPHALFRHAPALQGLMLRGIPAASASDAMRRLAALDKLATVQAIDLTGCNLSGAAIEGLLSGVLRPQRLTLNANPIGGHGIQVLTQAETLRSLESLGLANAQLQVYDVRVMSLSPTLQRLRGLNLSGNQIGDGGLRRLAFADNMRNLESLELADAEIGPDGLRSWSEGPSLGRLQQLDLSHNAIGDAGCVLLASSSNSSGLRHLKLNACEIEAEGLTRLAQSPYLRGLASLQLANNRLADGRPDFSAAFGSLQDLSLAGCDLRDEHLALLAEADLSASLERLDLSGNQLTFDGLRAVLSHPLVRRLTQLNLSDNRISQAGRSQLRTQLGSACIV